MTRRSTAAVLVALALTAGCGDGTSSARPESAPVAPTTSAGAQREAGVTDLESQVDGAARSGWPERYAGLEHRGGELVVYRKPSPELDAAVRRLAGTTPVSFRDARYSAQELDTLRQRVEADLERWRAQRVPVSSVGTAVDGSAVEVGTPEVDRVRRAFTARYGAQAPLRFVEVGPVVLSTG